MQTILTVVQIFLSLGLIGLVLIQHGRGADAGAAFGSGASATVFGARGSGSFLTRTTAILATLFFLTSMALAYYAAQTGKPAGLMQGLDQTTVKPPVKLPEAPVVPAASEVPAIPTAAQGAAQPTGSGSDVPVLPSAPAAGAEGPAAGVPRGDAPAEAAGK